MSMLILPRRFSAETASVDWSNPIAARFSAISVPLAGGLSRNFARPGGKPVETYGVSTGTSIKVTAGLGGMGMDGTAITTQSHRLHSVANATTTAWEEPLTAATWFAVLVRRGNNANGNAPIFANGAPSTAPYNAYAILDSFGGGTANVECSAGNASRSATAGVMSNNKLTVIVGRYTGYTLAGFLNGVKYASETSCAGNLVYANATNRGPSVGSYYDYTDTARSFNGQIYLVGVAPVALSDAEIRDLSANPWQLLAAPDDIIWLDAGGGATSVYSDLVDSTTILNSVSSDFADSAAILASTSSDLADSAVILNSTSSDLGDSALIYTSASSDLADSYDIQASSTVTSDLSDSATIFNTVSSDLADSSEIRVAVAADLADSAGIFSVVLSDLADSATITNTVSSDLADAVTVFASVTSDLIDSAAIWAGTGGGASAAEIVAAIWAQAATTPLPVDLTAIANAVWNRLTDTTYTSGDLLRLIAAMAAGRVSGAQTGTEVFRDVGDTKARITATVDAQGNRTAITLDPS